MYGREKRPKKEEVWVREVMQRGRAPNLLKCLFRQEAHVPCYSIFWVNALALLINLLKVSNLGHQSNCALDIVVFRIQTFVKCNTYITHVIVYLSNRMM